MIDHVIPSQEGRPVCGICGEQPASDWIGDHLAEAHGVTVDEYLLGHPGHPTVSPKLAATISKRMDGIRRTPASASNLTTTIGGVTFRVHEDVPASACLSMPSGYMLPEEGELAKDVRLVMVHLLRGRSCWVWGGPGTGKDAVFSFFSATTRTPGLLFSVTPGGDIQAWKFTRSFDHRGTMWEEGMLLRALRDGYLTPSGRRVPYLIVFSDIDRATRNQMEELRLILDSIEGRIQGPDGRTYSVLKGTRIVATANTSGGGDNSGRMHSANVIDASIKDRWNRNVRFHNISRFDEQKILVGKFPELAAKFPTVIPMITEVSEKVRGAVEAQEIFCEWSHRAVHAWAEGFMDIHEVTGENDVAKLLRASLRGILDGMPNDDTRMQVEHIVFPTTPVGATI